MIKSDSKRNSKQDPVEEEEEMETGGGKTKKKKSEEMGVAISHETNKVEGETSSSEAMDKKDEELEYEAESEESDDGVKEGEKPTYLGECDVENPLTSPWIRKRFKRERKQRLKEIEDLKQKAKKVKEKFNETKRLKRQKKRKELEDEIANADPVRLEERLGHMFQRKEEKMMKRMMSHNEYEPEGSHYRRGYRDRLYRGRFGSGERGDWMRGYGIMDHRSQYHMYEYLEKYREYQMMSSYSAREGGHDSKRKSLERQILMMMDDESSSETSDCSELEDIEIEIYKMRCLNMKISDFIDLKTVKDQFSNKMMLSDAHTAERLLELHPEIKEDRTFVSAMVYQAALSQSSSCLRTLFHRTRAPSSRPSPHADHNGKTPLHIACEKDSVDIILTLTHFKAKIDKRDNNGNTPLMTAMMHGASKATLETLIAKTKLKLTEHTNNKGYCLLSYHGPWSGSIRVSTRSNEDSLAYLLSVAKEKNELKALLSHVIPENKNPPLFQALSASNVANAKLLILYGADVNYRHPAQPNLQPIHLSAKIRSVEIMRLLLENGAAPDAKDSNGWTVLHHLFRPYIEHMISDRDMIECCMVLAEHGANFNISLPKSGYTPFHITMQFAARNEVSDHVIKLLRMGGNALILDWYYNLTPYEISKRARDPSLKAIMETYVLNVKSLAESCKWVIRQSMGEHGSIYRTAGQLPLPKHIIKYITEVDLDIEKELEESKAFKRPDAFVGF